MEQQANKAPHQDRAEEKETKPGCGRSTDEEACRKLRKKIFLMAWAGGTSHLASSYSCLEILYTLYMKDILRCDRDDPKWVLRDRLVLSKGHAGMALYAVMAYAGLLPAETLNTYLQKGFHLGGEPSMRDLPQVEASTGALGHGLSMGAGMAMAQKLDRTDARTFVILGDGECQEGTVWEAAISAAAYNLDNLTAVLDCNGIQKMGAVEDAMGKPRWREKWESFGWQVTETDGHDVNALEECLRTKNEEGKPRLIIAHTIKGKGVSIMEGNPNWHFKSPNKKERRYFMQELGISEEELALACRERI